MGTNTCRGTFIASLVIASLAACSDGDPPVSPPSPYTVEVTGDPARLRLALSQDGDGVWQPFTLDAGGHATVQVTRGFHGIAYACELGDPRFASLWVRYSAGTQSVVACPPGGSGWHTVEGDVLPATAEVYAGAMGEDLNDGGHYQGSVYGPRADLVALAGARMLVVHDVDVTVAGTHDLDAGAGGFELAAATPAVSGVPAGATTALYTELHTTHETYVYLPAADGAVQVVPAAARVEGDRVVVGVYVDDGTVTRGLQHRIEGDAVPPLALPPAPMLELDRTGVRWDGGWEAVTASLSVAVLGADRHGMSEYLRADAAWIAAHGDTTLAWIDPAALPGWDPAWPRFTAGDAPRCSGGLAAGAFDGELHTASRSGTLTW